MNNLLKTFLFTSWFVILFCWSDRADAESPVRFDNLLSAAVESDQWIKQNISLERAYRDDAVASGELPDPRLSVAFANLPTDTFNFSQEPMTQVVIGISQAFPGGDSRSLSRSRMDLLGDMTPIQRMLRREQLHREISLVWLDARLAETSTELIREDRPLFEQLIKVAEGRYGTAFGKTNRQDVIRAQLELTRLDERVLRLNELSARKYQKLGEWVPAELLERGFDWKIPAEFQNEKFVTDFLSHPEILILDQEIKVKRTEHALAEETRKPGWSIATSYAVRDQDRFGNDRSDLFTVGVTMDLPLFTGNRQSRKIAAVANRVSAAESGRLLRLQQLKARYNELKAAFDQFEQQLSLYEGGLLTQTEDMANAALSGYQADESDFADVARAYVALLNTKIEIERLRTERYKAIAELHYLTATYNSGEAPQ